jgi:hypothetical protein
MVIVDSSYIRMAAASLFYQRTEKRQAIKLREESPQMVGQQAAFAQDYFTARFPACLHRNTFKKQAEKVAKPMFAKFLM